MEHDAKIRVRYAETDQMGVVYYANFLIWFEVGRTEFYRSLAMPYKSFEAQGIMLPVKEVYCNYQQPARYDDEIIIRTRVENLTKARIVFTYEIIRYETKELLATGKSTHPFVNNDGKPINLAKVGPNLWAGLSKALEDGIPRT